MKIKMGRRGTQKKCTTKNISKMRKIGD